jgi:hypothetical protein
MMYRCATQFEVEDKQLTLKKEYLSIGDIEADREEKNTQSAHYHIDPISDDEEDDAVAIQEQAATQGLSQRAAEKRRKSNASETDNEVQEATLCDDEVVNPLPETQLRVSGRNRKRTRRDDDQFIEY